MSDTLRKPVEQGVQDTATKQSLATFASLASRLRLLDVWSLALYGILGLAAFLRFYRLDASSLWSDEGNSWAQLDRSLADIARAAAADIHPPGYYWLLKGWTTLFGTDAIGLRSFSALAGILLIWAIYHIALLLPGTAPTQNPKSKIQNCLLCSPPPSRPSTRSKFTTARKPACICYWRWRALG